MPVFVLCNVSSVKPFAEMATARFGTSITTIRSFYQSLANLLLELIADRITFAALIAEIQAPFCSAYARFRATIRVFALVKRASTTSWFFHFQMLLYFFGYCGGISV